MSDFKKHLSRQLEDPEFAAEWENQRQERECIHAVIIDRLKQNLMQVELAKKTGIHELFVGYEGGYEQGVEIDWGKTERRGSMVKQVVFAAVPSP